MSKERIEELAEKMIKMPFFATHQGRKETIEFLAALPEFQAPKSPWIQCSERMPTSAQKVLFRFSSGNFCWYLGDSDTGNPDTLRAIAWMEIPPCVAPESELVRRFKAKCQKDRLGNMSPELAVSILTECEKEIADGK